MTACVHRSREPLAFAARAAPPARGRFRQRDAERVTAAFLFRRPRHLSILSTRKELLQTSSATDRSVEFGRRRGAFRVVREPRDTRPAHAASPPQAAAMM